MNCDTVRDTLLQCESPRLGDLPADLVAHLERCPACMALLGEIAALEQSWRTTPLPAECETSKAAFLAKLEPAVTTLKPATARSLPAVRWAVAASLLLVAILGGWFAMSNADASVQDKVMDRLVDWNLQVAKAPVARPPEVVAQEREQLQTLVRTASLSDEDRALAETMLETGAFLAANDDALAAADRFDQIAEQMQIRLDKADRTGDGRAVGKWARRFGSISERGVQAHLDDSKKKNQHLKDRQKFETIAGNDRKRQEAVADIVQRHPDRTPGGKKGMKGKK